MFLDGVEGDHELAGDGLIRPARRQHFQDLELAAGQTITDLHAVFVDWEQDSPDLPDWQTSCRHLTADDKVAELTAVRTPKVRISAAPISVAQGGIQSSERASEAPGHQVRVTGSHNVRLNASVTVRFDSGQLSAQTRGIRASSQQPMSFD